MYFSTHKKKILLYFFYFVTHAALLLIFIAKITHFMGKNVFHQLNLCKRYDKLQVWSHVRCQGWHVTCHMSLHQQPQPRTLPLLTTPLCKVWCCCWSWPRSINNEWQRPKKRHFFAQWLLTISEPILLNLNPMSFLKSFP